MIEMRSNSLLAILCLLATLLHGQTPSATIQAPPPTTTPHLVRNNGCIQLSVDNHPFLIRGGELGNSSASGIAYMKPIWPKLVKMHLNTVIAPVYWELLEPKEGQFDYTLVDALIGNARQYRLRLVLLWFGTWKNSMSCYVPAWMKTDQSRYPRSTNSAGRPEEIITPFSENALTADKNAFKALMRHLKTIDAQQHTVLMIQVENEIGMLPEARDHSPRANEAFNNSVPKELIDYLVSHRNTLVPEMEQRWSAGGNQTSGTWEEIFGKGSATDELFMAWYFGKYVQEIAQAGKRIYDIPLYLNAALNAPGRKPGEYPSAGPLPHVMDVWKAAAPDIDFLSPDFYNPNFRYWCDRYSRKDNPLFIPEHRFEAGADVKALYAFGHYQAIGFSPFSIESTPKPESEPIGKCYELLAQLADQISAGKTNGRIDGVLLSKDADTTRLEMGAYKVTAAHDLRLGWSPKAKDTLWPLTGGIIIGLSPDEFYVAGTGIVLTFQPKGEGRAGILSVEEGRFVNGKWQPGRRMNGDQDHQGRHVRIPEGEYGIQRVKLYTYR
jgi:beta-galactosidase GanA